MSNVLRTLAALTAVCVVSCAQQHEGPQSSDTVTNWLRRCDSEHDCTGAASCVNALCTVACDVDHSDACGEARSGLVCDAPLGACDFPCQDDRACDALGRGYACEAGRCRARVDLISAPSTSAISSQFDDSLLSIGSTNQQLTLDEHDVASTPLELSFELSRTGYDNQDPQVYWTGEHFRVMWRESNEGLGMAEVAPTGDYTTASVAVSMPSASRLVPNGTQPLLTGVNHEPDGSMTCVLQALDFDAWRAGSLVFFPCYGRLLAQPVVSGDSTEWVVSWRRGTPPPGETMEPVAVAGYRPNSSNWSHRPRTLSIPFVTTNLDSMAVRGSELWLGLRRDSVYRFGDAPSLLAAAVDAEAIAEDEYARVGLSGEPTDGQLWPLEQGVLVVRRRSDSLELLTIQGDGTQLEPRYVAAETQGLPGFARLVERQMSAICLPGPSGVSVAFVSDQGKPIADPTPVDDDQWAYACDLAWSGQELLVVWRRLVDGEVSQNAIRAKIVDVPR